MAEQQIRVYGATWCSDTKRARQFFQDHGVRYEWHDIDQDEKNLAYLLQANDGKQATPTILFPDGSILVEPSNDELVKKLGL